MKLGQQEFKKRFNCDDLTIEDCDNSDQEIKPEKVFVHENYNSQTFENNIAIIKLSEPANLRGRSVRPICLPTEELLQLEFYDYAITGWKKSDLDRQHHTSLERVNNNDCEKSLKTLHPNFAIHDTMFCVESKGEETCDSK